jgi:hypothetical protein
MARPEDEKRGKPLTVQSDNTGSKSATPPSTDAREEWRIEKNGKGSYMVLESPRLQKILVG